MPDAIQTFTSAQKCANLTRDGYFPTPAPAFSLGANGVYPPSIGQTAFALLGGAVLGFGAQSLHGATGFSFQWGLGGAAALLATATILRSIKFNQAAAACSQAGAGAAGLLRTVVGK